MTETNALIQNAGISIHFQPVASLRSGKVIGFEALARTSSNSAQVQDMFLQAKRDGDVLFLDRHCRELAMVGFAKIRSVFPEALLFLNVEPSIVDEGVVGSGKFRELCMSQGVPPDSVVIEVIESEVKNEQALIEFCQLQKRFGFLIAIDDMGAGHSNLNRIPQFQPDIIKIDRALLSGLHNDYKKQQLVRFLTDLSSNIGTLILGEGLESQEEVQEFYSLGGDLAQGFYFSKPVSLEETLQLDLASKLKWTLEHSKDAIINRLGKRRAKISHYQLMAKELTKELIDREPEDYADILKSGEFLSEGVECTYVIDRHGKQITDTFLYDPMFRPKNGVLFQCASKGDFHTYKDYYYTPFQSGIDLFTSEPYLSKATGNLCRTYSVRFAPHNHEECILCLDVLENGE